MTIAVIIIGYLLLNFLIGFWGHKKGTDTPEDFFLAGRNTNAITLFFTLVATNFSAFFFLGFAGQGYKIGYGYYGIMAFGTSIVALTFYYIGYQVWILGKKYGFITPPELIGHLTKSRKLKLVYLAVMVIFTLPYLAIQPIGAGILLEQLTDGAISQITGATLLTFFIVFYVFVGGMRSVALTDILQGVLMIFLMGAAVWVIADGIGGFEVANINAFNRTPELFTHAGVDNALTPQKWFSYMILWSLTVPMFPQMFMRFFIAKSAKSLQTSTILYPVVTTILFLFPIAIGVMGTDIFPNLTGREIDQILPLMLHKFAPEWLAAFIMVGAIAAFMSTMDSQLLALSSMLTRDLLLDFSFYDISIRRQVSLAKWLVVVLAFMGLLIAVSPPDTIFAIATMAFTGLAVLFPTTIFVLYWKKTTATSCIYSIIVGELILIGFTTDFIPESFALGFLPLVPIIIISTSIILIGSHFSATNVSSSA